MAQVIAHLSAAPQLDALRALIVCACGLALIAAGYPGNFAAL